MNLGDMFKQAREMQSRLSDVQESLKNASVTGESGAGLVKVTLSGRYEALKVEIDPLAAEEERAVQEDLIAAAFNDAVRRVEAMQKERMSDLAQGFGLPPGFNLPGSLQ
ncbi:MAG: YbaB/EbfC family nucleoid-associated protein [Gammaproteobacteria bacterium]|nr:YbaB/EbfC family nucleoid-associated protein [Gammaproteobacteria bacterium]MYF30879.1 YbaB/EbfC family nucleoid-associated protein [Gammaproteobacteria bacterium]MYK45689.1 YbaB/EbfC family nucleoid-associated protein [Gammaproteobacteria bacterium]